MNRAIAALRLLRMAFHARAYALHSTGRSEAAQTYWSAAEDLTAAIELLERER